MRLAIALAKQDETKVYPGPFGHAPRFAIYEVAEDCLLYTSDAADE